MTTSDNPRAELDATLAVMRAADTRPGNPERVKLGAMVACAEALSLLVDAHLAAVKPKPEPEPRESLPDDMHVGHGWVVDCDIEELFKPEDCGLFTLWNEELLMWGLKGNWHKSGLPDLRPATVGDLRRRGVPTSEWPDITAPDPERVELSRAEKAEAALRASEMRRFEAEESEGKAAVERANAIAERDNAIAALRAVRRQMVLGVCLTEPNGDMRKTHRQFLTIVEAEARRRGIDLDEEAS